MDNKWEHDQYNDAFEAIKLVAKAKMVMNYHKGDIAAVDVDKLLTMLSDEVDELTIAIGQDNIMHVIEEAADVFNFLVALTHKQIEEYRTRKSVHSTISELNKKDTHQ